jgi:aspartyl-tRNA(Asn)/glutamyl-tRNA(Gln) amidotransferase subunit A
MTLHTLTVHEAGRLLRAGDLTSVALTHAVLDRIHEVDPQVRAYLTVSEDEALAAAERADRRLQRGEDVTPLTGIPYAVKDSLSTRGVRTTCASRILENYVPQYDATVISRLKRAGAVLVGKHNMDEFGMGSSCENSAYFNTHNPWDLDRVPGGSSGGSAAAVAAEMALFALGEDTGGSIRMPAGFCGVTGLKPTYGRVSRYGLIALASSFDSIGPITHDARDAALVMTALAGRDPMDSTSRQAPVPDYEEACEEDLTGLTLGVPAEYFGEGLASGVEEAIQAAIEHMADLGAEIEEVSLPHTRYAIPVYYTILFAEASANLARFDGVRFGLSCAPEDGDVIARMLQTREQGFGDEVKRRIMLGTFALSSGYYDAYYLRAQRVRTLLRQDFERAFDRVDALVAPVCPTAAFRIGARIDDPLKMYLSDIHVVAANPAGVPALALPCGFAPAQPDGAHMPVGMQVIGPPMGEPLLFRIGAAYQRTTDWHRARPPLSGRASDDGVEKGGGQ